MTATHLLAGVLLGRPLVEYVEEKRSARPQWSWPLIAEELAKDTDGQVTVSREWLRRWFEPVEAKAS